MTGRPDEVELALVVPDVVAGFERTAPSSPPPMQAVSITRPAIDTAADVRAIVERYDD
jgi:hypothetical protein